MAYSYINQTEGVGFTGNVILKGMAQVGAGTLDQALNPTNGLTELLSLALIIAAFGFVVVGVANIGKSLGV